MSETTSTRSNPTLGLTSAEAERRLASFGPNEIVPSRLESSLSELKQIFLDPMGLMLLGLSGLYWLLGDTTDAVILLLAFIPVTAVDVILELRARKALRSLRATLKATAKVLRDGQLQDVAIRHIVAGDVIAFEEGQSLPADGRVIQAEQLTINEAALTGESVPVDKIPESEFFGGTVVLQGRGLGLVEKIGKQTRFGNIATLLEETEAEKTPLQKKVDFLVRRVIVVALGLAILLFAIELLRGSDLIHGLIVALTFGMAVVPEEFPLVFTLYLSLGAWRLSRYGVLVKSLPSVEALGSVDVICTDKTGTLTEGRFQLEDLRPLRSEFPKELLWQCALMACEPEAVDAMEMAIVEKGQAFRTLLVGWRLEWDYPFEQEGKHMSHVWKDGNGRTLMAMKGAVEGVLEHCEITPDRHVRLTTLAESLSSQGKRLLGLAYRDGGCVGDRERDETNLRFLGLLVFSDPMRGSAKAAIAACQEAGIEVKMLTGDHPLTAHAVADQTGIAHTHDALFTGGQLAAMPQEQRWKAYQTGAIFSRVVPEQKHEMVQALKAAGSIVAMTGDGINDAPALKLADIGISMGLNATDVARSTAQMILLKNDFKGIVEAVFEGRRVFANLKRSFSYLISFHIPVIALAFIPPLLGWGELLLPVHIVLLELIVHPVSAFAFENLPHAELSVEKALLPMRRFIEAALAGALLSLGSLVLFRMYTTGDDIGAARSLALATVLLGNIAFVFVESWPVKTIRLFITAVSLLALAMVTVRIPQVAEVLHLGIVGRQDLLVALGVGFIASLPSFLLRTVPRRPKKPA